MSSDMTSKLGAIWGIVALQIAATVYFLVDAVAESGWLAGAGITSLSVLDVLVGMALLAGTAFSANRARRMQREAKRQAQALAIARGALGEMIDLRFAEWGLTAGEADVALLSLKGFAPAEIARLRGSASGTVRSQLSQVYAKAEVSGQPMLMALFLDELIDQTG